MDDIEKFLLPLQQQLAALSGSDATTKYEIKKFSLPLQPAAVPATATGGWVPLVAGLQTHEVVALLRERWSAFQVPYIQQLAATILGRSLQGLSIDWTGAQWLSFGDESCSLHLAPPSQLPDAVRSEFPFHRIPGLADFLENFGGLADSARPLFLFR